MNIEDALKLELNNIKIESSESLKANVIQRLESASVPRRTQLSRLKSLGAGMAGAFLVLVVIGSIVLRHGSSSTLARHAVDQKSIQTQMLGLLPKGSEFLSFNHNQRVLSVNIGDRAKHVYVAGYQNPSGTTGVVVADMQQGVLQRLWQGDSFGAPILVYPADLLHNGQQELIVEGDGQQEYKNVDILKFTNGQATTMLRETASRIDIGAWRTGYQKQIALWIYKLPGLYKVNVYDWSGTKHHYVVQPNFQFPTYFKDSVIPFYVNSLTNGKPSNRATAYGLSEAYFYAGEDKEAIKFIRLGMALPNVQSYPTNAQFQALEAKIHS